jgi:hypothetical protein
MPVRKQSLKLSKGHHEIIDPVIDLDVIYPAPNLGVLTLLASIGGPLNPALQDHSEGRTATTLAFQMDVEAAKQLFRRLSVTGRSMGWLPLVSDENQV